MLNIRVQIEAFGFCLETVSQRSVFANPLAVNGAVAMSRIFPIGNSGLVQPFAHDIVPEGIEGAGSRQAGRAGTGTALKMLAAETAKVL
jgi:uncharacterized protein YqgC (DUF456 family)